MSSRKITTTNDAGKHRELARAAVGTYSTSLLVSVLSLANVIVVSRALGAEGRGSVAFLTAVAIFMQYASTLGVHEAISNIAARDQTRRRSLATNAVLLSVILGALAAAAIAALVWAAPGIGGDVNRRLLWCALGSIPIMILQTFLGRLLRATYEFALVNLALIVAPLAILSFNLLLAILGHLNVALALAGWIVGNAASCALLIGIITARFGFGKPDSSLAISSIRFGLKTHGGAVMMMGNYRLDQWILGAIGGSRELGLYSVAVAWSEGLFYIGEALASVARPDLAQASRERAVALTARIARIAFAITMPLAGILALGAPLLLVFVFGEDFRGAVDDLRVLALGALGVVALKVVGPTLVAQERPLLESAAIGVGFIIMLVGNFLLIPPLGGLGAAIASAVAYTATGLFVVVFFLRTLGGTARLLVPGLDDVREICRRLAPAATLAGARAWRGCTRCVRRKFQKPAGGGDP